VSERSLSASQVAWFG